MEHFTTCLMPSHWHRVPRAAGDDELAEFMRWLTITHALRWRVEGWKGREEIGLKKFLTLLDFLPRE